MGDPQVWHDLLRGVSLTEPESEVFNFKARRRTNAEIAEQLIISITAVKWYVRQIYNKLGVNNRTEVVATARRLGLLENSQHAQSGQNKEPSLKHTTIWPSRNNTPSGPGMSLH